MLILAQQHRQKMLIRIHVHKNSANVDACKQHNATADICTTQCKCWYLHNNTVQILMPACTTQCKCWYLHDNTVQMLILAQQHSTNANTYTTTQCKRWYSPADPFSCASKQLLAAHVGQAGSWGCTVRPSVGITSHLRHVIRRHQHTMSHLPRALFFCWSVWHQHTMSHLLRTLLFFCWVVHLAWSVCSRAHTHTYTQSMCTHTHVYTYASYT